MYNIRTMRKMNAAEVLVWRDDCVEVENEVHDSYLFVVHPIICNICI